MKIHQVIGVAGIVGAVLIGFGGVGMCIGAWVETVPFFVVSTSVTLVGLILTTISLAAHIIDMEVGRRNKEP